MINLVVPFSVSILVVSYRNLIMFEIKSKCDFNFGTEGVFAGWIFIRFGSKIELY